MHDVYFLFLLLSDTNRQRLAIYQHTWRISSLATQLICKNLLNGAMRIYDEPKLSQQC